MKTDLFQSCGHCWVFQMLAWVQHFKDLKGIEGLASSLRIWNSSTGIPSPPLTLFVVMLPKAHLTSHSRISGSRWVITPLWLYGSLRSFLCEGAWAQWLHLYSPSVYSCHLCLILEKAMAPHSSTLAWKIPWMEEPGSLQSMGSLRVKSNTTSLLPFSFMH